MNTHRQKEILDFANKLKAHGFNVYLSTGSADYHGFYTDTNNTRIVSFERKPEGIVLSGNYEPLTITYTNVFGNISSIKTGTGWMISNNINNITTEGLNNILYAIPPMNFNPNPTYTTPDKHLKRYACCNYAMM